MVHEGVFCPFNGGIGVGPGAGDLDEMCEVARTAGSESGGILKRGAQLADGRSEFLCKAYAKPVLVQAVAFGLVDLLDMKTRDRVTDVAGREYGGLQRTRPIGSRVHRGIRSDA